MRRQLRVGGVRQEWQAVWNSGVVGSSTAGPSIADRCAALAVRAAVPAGKLSGPMGGLSLAAGVV